MITTLRELRADYERGKSKDSPRLWFSPETMDYWGTSFPGHGRVYGGPRIYFFVTEDRAGDGNRFFSVRRYDPDKKSITIEGERCGFATYKDAALFIGEISVAANREPETVATFERQNPNCDGSGPCDGTEVRVLPTGPQSNAIVCRACFGREITWRRLRNIALAADCRFDLPAWNELEVYAK